VLLNDLLNIFGYFLNIGSMKARHLQPVPWINPFSFFYSFSLVYFIAGGLIVRYFKNLNFKIITCVLLFVLSCCLLFLFGLMKTNTGGKVYDTVYGGYDSIMTLTMAIMVFILCSKIKINNAKFKKVVRIVSANTLGIYLIHVPLGYWLSGFYGKIWLHSYLFFNLCYALLIMFLSLIVSLIIRRIPVFNNLVKI
jgi:surface polysaccharide O-acyltransferase-like enzyme